MRKRHSIIWNTVKEYKQNSIFFKIFIIALIIILVPIIILCSFMLQKYDEEVRQNAMVCSEQISSTVSDVFEKVQYCLDIVSTSDDIGIWLGNNKNYAYFFNSSAENTIELLKNLKQYIFDVESIYLYNPKNNYIITDTGHQASIDGINTFFDMQSLDEYYKSGKTFFIRTIANRTFFSVFKKINYTVNNEGMFIFNFDIKKFDGILSGDGIYCLCDKDKNILCINQSSCYSDMQTLLNSADMDEIFIKNGQLSKKMENNYVFVSDIYSGELYSVYVSDLESAYMPKAVVFLFVFFIIAFTLAVSLFLTAKFYRIVLDLIDVVENSVDDGGLR